MILVLGKVGQRATFLLFAVLGPFLAILFRLLQGKFFKQFSSKYSEFENVLFYCMSFKWFSLEVLKQMHLDNFMT